MLLCQHQGENLCFHCKLVKMSQLQNKYVDSFFIFILKCNNVKQRHFLGDTFQLNIHKENSIPLKDSLDLDFYRYLSGFWNILEDGSASILEQGDAVYLLTQY